MVPDQCIKDCLKRVKLLKINNVDHDRLFDGLVMRDTQKIGRARNQHDYEFQRSDICDRNLSDRRR